MTHKVNPSAILLIAFAAVIGALAGNILMGLAIGLGFVLVATFIDAYRTEQRK